MKQLDKNWIKGAKYTSYITNGILFGFPIILLSTIALGIAAAVLVTGVLTIVFTNLFINLTYKNYKYELTKDELKIEKGIITKTYKSIPFSRIQNIEIKRGIFARMLGYSAVAIHTAGYSSAAQYYAPEGNLPGVSIKEAENLRKELIKRSKNNS